MKKVLNNKQLEKMFAKALEETDFDYDNLEFEDNNVSIFLCAYSTYGGENSCDFNGNNFIQLLENIIYYADNFDADEEFDLWYGRNNGEPSTPSVLLEDCEDKQGQWETLSTILRTLLVEIETIEDYGIEAHNQFGVDSYYFKCKCEEKNKGEN